MYQGDCCSNVTEARVATLEKRTALLTAIGKYNAPLMDRLASLHSKLRQLSSMLDDVTDTVEKISASTYSRLKFEFRWGWYPVWNQSDSEWTMNDTTRSVPFFLFWRISKRNYKDLYTLSYTTSVHLLQSEVITTHNLYIVHVHYTMYNLCIFVIVWSTYQML